MRNWRNDMEESTAPSPEPSTDAEYEAAVNEVLAEMRRMDQQADHTPRGAEQPGDESATILTALERVTTRMDRCLASLDRVLLELQHHHKIARLQHENLILRLEKVLLRFERRLPRGSSPDNGPVV
jgi:hypothetical protein